VTAAFVLFVEVDGVVHVKMAHIFGEGLSLDFDKQMVVVGHEAVVVYGDVMASSMSAHELFEVFIIFFFVFEDYSLFNTSVDDMIKAVDFYTGFSGHGILLLVV